ncbi:hypothetical protein JTB14_023122 [Gonioctena quinquepunctata]|nr:hypothetical protein JTB14_023122 [Gonioctena quinquepunctata]
MLLDPSIGYIAGQNEGQPSCYGRTCPAGTSSCKKHIKSTVGRKFLDITINCLDDFNGSLKEYFFEEISTLNSNTHYESTSYSGTADVNNNFVDTFRKSRLDNYGLKISRDVDRLQLHFHELFS